MALRNWIILTSASVLAACGGDTGVETVGGSAPPTSSTPDTPDEHSFVNPTEAKSYDAIGGVQHYEYHTDSNKDGQGGQLYAGDANTPRASGISISYDPRDAIFELTISRPKGEVTLAATRFQDPAHRTDFGGAAGPQAGVPQFDASREIQYLQFGSGDGSHLSSSSPYGPGSENSDLPVMAPESSSDVYTLFYQKPGTTTDYVTYAGYVRNSVTGEEIADDPNSDPYLRENYALDRGAFVFGERTANSAVPTSGSGTFTGDMIATMVFNPDIDTMGNAPTYFQWMQGSQTTKVDFGTLKVTSDFTGTVFDAARDAYTNGNLSLPAGSKFSASASATLDLVNKGGFTGSFDSAKFERPGMDDFTLNIAGSSIDGAFFGPNGEELGGGFRIVGGTPDERIDIVGAYTGKK